MIRQSQQLAGIVVQQQPVVGQVPRKLSSCAMTPPEISLYVALQQHADSGIRTADRQKELGS